MPALNQTRTVTRNSQGKVVSVTDALGNTMSHAYDALGNPVQSTDAVGNVVTATYDLRGRKIRLDILNGLLSRLRGEVLRDALA